MHADTLGEDMVRDTLNVLLKHESDIEAVDLKIGKLVRNSVQGGRAR